MLVVIVAAEFAGVAMRRTYPWPGEMKREHLQPEPRAVRLETTM